jgi:hypothetical protein
MQLNPESINLEMYDYVKSSFSRLGAAIVKP